jgi:ribonuclease BN (tRNA processing enzyme)
VATELPTNSDTWYDYVRDFDSQDGEAETGLCTPEDAAQYATELGVERLVLTHHLPYRDPAEMATRAESEFSGTVTVADDLQTLTV